MTDPENPTFTGVFPLLPYTWSQMRSYVDYESVSHTVCATPLFLHAFGHALATFGLSNSFSMAAASIDGKEVASGAFPPTAIQGVLLALSLGLL